MKARIDYPKGYNAVIDPIRSNWYRTIWEFTADEKSPITAIDKDGVHYRTDRHYFSDCGSIPKLLRFFVSSTRFLFFWFHDALCKFGGLWVWKSEPVVNASGIVSFKPTGEAYVFVKFTRAEADALLHDFVLADPKPGWGITADAVWLGVRIGSLWTGSSYGKGDAKFRNC